MTWWDIAALAFGGLLATGGLVLTPLSRGRTSSPSARAGRTGRAFQAALSEAGLGSLRPGVAVVLWCVVVVVVMAIVALVIPIPVVPLLAGITTALAGRWLVASRRSARQRRLRRAWPGLIDHLRTTIRSGGSIAEAVSVAGRHVPEELKEPFARFDRGVESGLRLDAALAMLKDDLADPVSDRIVEVLRMAHEVGGRELPSVLHALQHGVRTDIAVREDALAKQSWIRAASRMGVAAPWLVLAVLSGRPETIRAYDSLWGGVIIVSGAVVSGLAFRMMSRLGQLPNQRRWFASDSTGIAG